MRNADAGFLLHLEFSVVFNNDDGTFGPPSDYHFGTGVIAVGDFDADGDVDLLLSPPFISEHDVITAVNDGTGGFSAGPGYVTPDPWAGGVSDFDGDGDLDVVIASNDSTSLSVLVNDGSGLFSLRPQEAMPLQRLNLIVADMNGDEADDVITMNWGDDNISLFLNARRAAAIVAAGEVGIAAPPPTLGPYAMTFFPPDPQPELAVVSGVASPLGGTVGFAPALEHFDIPIGWTFWSHGYQGDVYWTMGSQQVTLTMPAGTKAFSFYVQPNPFGTFSFTATAHDGTALTQRIVSSMAGGATYYGFYATGDEVIATIEVQGPVDFAIGEFAISSGKLAPQPEDLNVDGHVDGFDLALLLSAWGVCPPRGSCPADLDGNGIVNGFDLALLLAAWG